MQDLSPRTYNFLTGLYRAMHCYIISLSLSEKQPTVNAELRRMSGDIHSQTGKYNASFDPAALVFQISVQDPVSHIQSNECNSTIVSK